MVANQVTIATSESQCLNVPAPTAFHVAFKSPLHLSVFPKAGFTLFCAVWISPLAWVTYNVFLKEIPSLPTWEELPLEAEDLFPFPIMLSMPSSLERDPSSLASLPSHFRLLTLLSQHKNSWTTVYSPGFWLKSSRIYCGSLRHRDFLLTALFTNSSSSSFLSSDHLIVLLSCWPCCGVACLIHLLLPFLLLSELTFTSSISSCVELSVIQCQVGSLAQPGCWAQSSHSACHSAIRSRCLLFPLTILSSVEQNDCNSAGEGGGGGRHFPLDRPLEEQRCNCESFPLHGAQGLELVAVPRPKAHQCQTERLLCHDQHYTVSDNPNQLPRGDRAQERMFTAICTSLNTVWQQIHRHCDHQVSK